MSSNTEIQFVWSGCQCVKNTSLIFEIFSLFNCSLTAWGASIKIQLSMYNEGHVIYFDLSCLASLQTSQVHVGIGIGFVAHDHNSIAFIGMWVMR